jgi:hypothetical protein
MAAPKVALVRRPDHWRSYDIWQPLSGDADTDGEWVRWGFQCPWWDAADQTAAPEYQYTLSLVSCTAGIVRPCWFATVANGRLTEGGAWSAAAENAAGTYSGHIYRYATAATRTVSCKLPANADLVVVRYPPNTASGAVVAVAIGASGSEVDQPTLGFTTATGGSSNRITDHVFSVTPSGTDRSLKLTVSSFTSTQFTLIGILCYDTDGVADPRETDATDGFVRGNRHVELYYNLTGAASLQSVAAVGSGSVSHIPVRAYYGSYIMKKPNTTHLTLKQHNGGSANNYWTADNSPHYSGTDNAYTTAAVPVVTMDGVALTNIFDTAEVNYSVLFEKDSIVIRTVGTCGAAGDGTTTLEYTYSFTTDCLALGAKILFDETAGAANAAVSLTYLPSWTLNLADASTLLEVQTGYFMVPNDTTHYACGTDYSISSSTCDIYIDGVPYVVGLTTSGPESKIETNSTAATATKFYVSLGACPALEAIDDQVTWALGGTIRVRRKPLAYWGGAKG